MSALLAGFLGAIIGGSFVLCIVCAARGLFRESQDEQAGTPEGALHFPHLHHPIASGSKLGDLASYDRPSQGG